MKKIVFLAALSFSLMAIAQESTPKKFSPPAGNAMVGDTYGATLDTSADKKAISTKKLNKKLKKKAKLEDVVVTGKVIDVCEKKGCWFTVETPNNDRFFVKIKDYAFFVPTALEGKTVVMEGNAEVKTISVDEAKHYAEDAKKPQAEIDAITKPQKETRFVASGIRVIN